MKKMFLVHTASILHGVVVGVVRVWPQCWTGIEHTFEHTRLVQVERFFGALFTNFHTS